MRNSDRERAMRLVAKWSDRHECDADEAHLIAILELDDALTEAEDNSADVDAIQSELDEANDLLEKAENRLAEFCDASHRGMVPKIATDLFTHGGVACKLFREDGSEVDPYDVERSLKELFTREGVYDSCPS